jgi:hypothetical protein
MNLETQAPCRKKNGKECLFEFKIFVIEQKRNQILKKKTKKTIDFQTEFEYMTTNKPP